MRSLPAGWLPSVLAKCSAASDGWRTDGRGSAQAALVQIRSFDQSTQAGGRAGTMGELTAPAACLLADIHSAHP